MSRGNALTRWPAAGLLQRRARSCCVVVLSCLAIQALSAQAGQGVQTMPAYVLTSPATAAALSQRAASAHTRAVLVNALTNQNRDPRPLSWISGDAESLQALQDLPVLLNLALAWRLGWDAPPGTAAAQAARFRDQALLWMEAWIGGCRPSFMPLNDSRLDRLIFAWDLLKAAASERLQAKAERFLRLMAEGYLLDRNGQPKAEAGNHWQSHRLKLAGLAAFALGDAGLVRQVEAAFYRQIELNIGPDGCPRDFGEHDALAYAVYDLEALTVLCLAARAHGLDWLHYRGAQGASLDTALRWLAVYASGRSMHREFVQSPISAERELAMGQFQGLGQVWNPVGAGRLYWLATRLDLSWLELAAHLDQDQAWLGVLYPTPAPPPRPSLPARTAAKAGGAAKSSAAATGSAATSQYQALLQALQSKSGTSGGGSGSSAAAGAIPSLLSLLDSLGAGDGNVSQQ